MGGSDGDEVFACDILYREGSEMGGPDGDEVFACGLCQVLNENTEP